MAKSIALASAHPGWLRCSSVTYRQYAPSSRLEGGAPRRPGASKAGRLEGRALDRRAPRPRSSTDVGAPWLLPTRGSSIEKILCEQSTFRARWPCSATNRYSRGFARGGRAFFERSKLEQGSRTLNSELLHAVRKERATGLLVELGLELQVRRERGCFLGGWTLSEGLHEPLDLRIVRQTFVAEDVGSSARPAPECLVLDGVFVATEKRRLAESSLEHLVVAFDLLQVPIFCIGQRLRRVMQEVHGLTRKR